MANQQPALRLAFTGPPGVGKTAMTRYVDSLSPQEIDPLLSAQGYSAIHTIPMRQLLRWNGYEGPNRLRNLQEYHADLRRQRMNNRLLDRLNVISGGIVVLDSIRHEEDADYFMHKMGGHLIALSAPLNICHERYTSDNDDEKHTDVLGPLDSADLGQNDLHYIHRARNRAWDHAADELFADSSLRSHIANCMDRAIVTIDATQSKKQVAHEIVGHIREIALNI